MWCRKQGSVTLELEWQASRWALNNGITISPHHQGLCPNVCSLTQAMCPLSPPFSWLPLESYQYDISHVLFCACRTSCEQRSNTPPPPPPSVFFLLSAVVRFITRFKMVCTTVLKSRCPPSPPLSLFLQDQRKGVVRFFNGGSFLSFIAVFGIMGAGC